MNPDELKAWDMYMSGLLNVVTQTYDQETVSAMIRWAANVADEAVAVRRERTSIKPSTQE